MAIAVINPESRALIQAASSTVNYGDITDIAADLADFKNANGIGNAGKKIGDMENKWKAVVESIAQTGQTPSNRLIPQEAAKGIRIYQSLLRSENVVRWLCRRHRFVRGNAPLRFSLCSGSSCC